MGFTQRFTGGKINLNDRIKPDHTRKRCIQNGLRARHLKTDYKSFTENAEENRNNAGFFYATFTTKIDTKNAEELLANSLCLFDIPLREKLKQHAQANKHGMPSVQDKLLKVHGFFIRIVHNSLTVTPKDGLAFSKNKDKEYHLGGCFVIRGSESILRPNELFILAEKENLKNLVLHSDTKVEITETKDDVLHTTTVIKQYTIAIGCKY